MFNDSRSCHPGSILVPVQEKVWFKTWAVISRLQNPRWICALRFLNYQRNVLPEFRKVSEWLILYWNVSLTASSLYSCHFPSGRLLFLTTKEVEPVSACGPFIADQQFRSLLQISHLLKVRHVQTCSTHRWGCLSLRLKPVCSTSLIMPISAHIKKV